MGSADPLHYSFLLHFFSGLHRYLSFEFDEKDLIFRSCCFLIKHKFMNPVYVFERDDTDLLRKKIIEMSYTEWKKIHLS